MELAESILEVGPEFPTDPNGELFQANREFPERNRESGIREPE